MANLSASQCTSFLSCPLSFQAWGVRKAIVADFAGTLKRVAAMGYDGVEMCSPRGYGSIGFGPLTAFSAQQINQRIIDAGLFCKSCHFGRWEFKGDDVARTLEFAYTLGLKDCVVSAGISENEPLDMWKQVADDINVTARLVKDAGFQLVYHNGSMGPLIDGAAHYDHIISYFDPELVKLEFQVADIDRYSPEKYLKKYKGRISSLHMLDWSTEINSVTAIGYGVIDWKSVLPAAFNAELSDHGMIVEMDCAKPFDELEKSYRYLRGIAPLR